MREASRDYLNPLPSPQDNQFEQRNGTAHELTTAIEGTEIEMQMKSNERKGGNTGITAKHVSSEFGRAESDPSSKSTEKKDEGTITDAI